MRPLSSTSGVALAAVLLLTGCSSGEPDGPQVLVSVTAVGASYEFTSATLRSGYVSYLTLSGLDHGAIFITLSPEDRAWTGSPVDVVDFFGTESLNAVAFLPSTGDAVALSLAFPTYDAASGSLTFEAQGLADLGEVDVVSAPDGSLIPASQGEWGPITLLIDPPKYEQRETPDV